jgi:chemotaxis protein CheX
MGQAIPAAGEADDIHRMETQTEHLDTAVAEVFQLMMGVACVPAEADAGDFARRAAGATAIVGLAGALSGACVLRMAEPVALRLAELMTGSPMAAFDRIVKDALGEACNMLAGTWKGKLEEISPACMLSVPAVISGSNYEFHMPKPAFHLDRAYAFDGHRFTFCIDCVGL